MAFERNPKFYAELKQTNDDILKVLESFHKKSPYFNYSSTFQDYIKQIEELTSRYPVVTSHNDSHNKLANSSVTENLFKNSALHSYNDTNLKNNTSNNSFNIDGTTNTITPLNTTTELEPKAPLFFVPNPSASQPESTTAAGEEPEEDSTPPQPNIDKFEEPDSSYQARCKLYVRLIGDPNASSSHALLGCGSLFIKQLETPAKLHLIVRQDPDLRKVLLNQVITSSTILKQMSKAIQLIVPGEGGKTNCYVVKVKDDKVASETFALLHSVKNDF